MGEQGPTPGAESPTCSIEEFTSTSFDYIICGGGTAGCVIAARLTENPDVTVGVVEAGKYRIGDPLVDTPAAFLQMFEDPEYDWCLYSAPQVSRFPRGRRGSLDLTTFPMIIERESRTHSPYPSR
jgi:choline dehydrogenase-like flavoprotein